MDEFSFWFLSFNEAPHFFILSNILEILELCEAALTSRHEQVFHLRYEDASPSAVALWQGVTAQLVFGECIGRATSRCGSDISLAVQMT